MVGHPRGQGWHQRMHGDRVGTSACTGTGLAPAHARGQGWHQRMHGGRVGTSACTGAGLTSSSPLPLAPAPAGARPPAWLSGSTMGRIPVAFPVFGLMVCTKALATADLRAGEPCPSEANAMQVSAHANAMQASVYLSEANAVGQQARQRLTGSDIQQSPCGPQAPGHLPCGSQAQAGCSASRSPTPPPPAPGPSPPPPLLRRPPRPARPPVGGVLGEVPDVLRWQAAAAGQRRHRQHSAPPGEHHRIRAGHLGWRGRRGVWQPARQAALQEGDGGGFRQGRRRRLAASPVGSHAAGADGRRQRLAASPLGSPSGYPPPPPPPPPGQVGVIAACRPPRPGRHPRARTSMVSGRGPTKVMPSSAHRRAKLKFSDRKP